MGKRFHVIEVTEGGANFEDFKSADELADRYRSWCNAYSTWTRDELKEAAEKLLIGETMPLDGNSELYVLLPEKQAEPSGSWECPECSKRLQTPEGMKMHRKDAHGLTDGRKMDSDRYFQHLRERARALRDQDDDLMPGGFN